MPTELFPLGRVVMTTNLQGQLQEANPEGWEEELQGFIRRHVTGDWGGLFVLNDPITLSPIPSLPEWTILALAEAGRSVPVSRSAFPWSPTPQQAGIPASWHGVPTALQS